MNTQFLYSQDLSNYKTTASHSFSLVRFLYSQDLSNYKTEKLGHEIYSKFLYSQDLSNCKTKIRVDRQDKLFLYSQDLSNYTDLSIGLNLQCFFFPTYAIIILNREGFHDWRREYEAKTNSSISALCVGTCGMQQESRRGDNPGTNNSSSDNCSTDNGSPD